MVLTNLHWLRPIWLLALLPLAYLIWHLAKSNSHDGNWRAACDPHLLPHLLIKTERKSSLLPLYLLAFAWLLTIIALAGPSWSQVPQPVYRSLVSQVIVLDLSLNMTAADIPPNRCTRAKYKVIDILNRSQEEQTGMLAFAGQPYVVSPLTQDAATIAALIPELDPNIMPAQGNDINAALIKAAMLLKQNYDQKGKILLLTASPVTSQALATASRLSKEGITTSVLAVGTAQGAPIPDPNGGFLRDTITGNIQVAHTDFSGLEKLARAGGGKFASFSPDNKDINVLLAPQTKQPLALNTKATDKTKASWRDQGQWFVLLILPLALLAFRRGWFEGLA